MNKKGAMELSVSTIVIIVLAMSMLILGLILVKNIFSGATDISKLTEDQVKNEIKGLFSADKKLVIYPDSKKIEVKQGKDGAFGFGIKNTIQGDAGLGKTFSYEVKVIDKGNCGANTNIDSWLLLGKKGDNINIPVGGDPFTAVVRLQIPESAPLCLFRLQVAVKEGANNYASDSMDVEIRS